MMDDRFDDIVREVAQDYNAPPETPKEIMWARIEAVREERVQRRQQLRVLYSPWTRWGVGIAAALVIGIGLGRLTLTGPDTTPVAVTPEEEQASKQLAYRLVAAEHLARSETFLTSFRADAASGTANAEFWTGVGGLLSSTRLLLDSPAAQDAALKSLLEDLELVLVQIAQLSYERGDVELELVTEGIERRGLLPRLRTAIPAGPGVGIEGVL
jgi:hypothetical protein